MQHIAPTRQRPAAASPQLAHARGCAQQPVRWGQRRAHGSHRLQTWLPVHTTRGGRERRNLAALLPCEPASPHLWAQSSSDRPQGIPFAFQVKQRVPATPESRR